MSATSSARPPEPAAENAWALQHIAVLESSLQQLTGAALYTGGASGAARAKAIYEAPFVLLSHGTEPDPLFNYGNRTAQQLFEMDWDTLVSTPSRQSAEPGLQAEREAFMQRVKSSGFVDDYRGVRVSASGLRFAIENAVVWNLTDQRGALCGQAATFNHWQPLTAAGIEGKP